MKLQFLGTGSAFVSIDENFQSNMILQSDTGKRLLIDCGSDARHSLKAAGFTYKDIDCVYVSHFHADHVGGLEWLAFCSYFDEQAQKISLMIHPSMIGRLWNNVLSGGLQSLSSHPATINDFFEILSCQQDSLFVWESIPIQLVKTIHVYNGEELMPSYGIYFTTPKTQVFITTDTQFRLDYYMPYYNSADLIFQDCETTPHKGCVHAHFSELATLPASIKSKMWLYHYSTTTRFDAVAHGFKGYVSKGQIFDI